MPIILQLYNYQKHEMVSNFNNNKNNYVLLISLGNNLYFKSLYFIYLTSRKVDTLQKRAVFP
jgi:hypothetical protein